MVDVNAFAKDEWHSIISSLQRYSGVVNNNEPAAQITTGSTCTEQIYKNTI